MRWSAVKGDPARIKGDMLLVGVFAGDDGPDLDAVSGLDKTIGGGLAALADGKIFAAKAETSHTLPGGGAAVSWVMAMGLGERDDLTADRVRRCAALAVKKAREMSAGRCLVHLPGVTGGIDVDALARSFVEGAEMGLWNSGSLKTDRKDDSQNLPREMKLIAAADQPLPELKAGIVEGQAFAAGNLFARDLVNMPANLLGPGELAAAARAMARREGLNCRVAGPAELKKKGMGGVLGVCQGSRRDPRLIILESKPVRGAAKAPLVALIGKGVTFDAGGISLKPSAKMHEMKADMGGAAAVLGAVLIIRRLNLPVRLLVVVPAVENMPDGDAIRPGDVLNMASGKTVEVLNTDAEGRLILADALHLAGGRKPDFMIDAATLTGACVVALGSQFAGMFVNDPELGGAIDRAGGETFERVWRLPLIEDHHKAIESTVADLQNIGGRDGGALTAAAFLEEFVPEDIAWAHLDIAGPAWTDGAGPVFGKGASGYGARLLARTVQILSDQE